jgi:hypothetical protein
MKSVYVSHAVRTPGIPTTERLVLVITKFKLEGALDLSASKLPPPSSGRTYKVGPNNGPDKIIARHVVGLGMNL